MKGKRMSKKATTTYDWRAGTRPPSGVSAETIGRELDRHMGDEGKITAARVVEIARDHSSPLHSWFEWDDSKAAEAHRLQQARTLLRAVVVKVDHGQSQPIAVHVRTVSQEQEAAERESRDSRAGFYRRFDALPKHKVELIQAIADARSRVASAEEAVAQLMRLAGEVGDSNAAFLALAAQSMSAAKEAMARVSVH